MTRPTAPTDRPTAHDPTQLVLRRRRIEPVLTALTAAPNLVILGRAHRRLRTARRVARRS